MGGLNQRPLVVQYPGKLFIEGNPLMDCKEIQAEYGAAYGNYLAAAPAEEFDNLSVLLGVSPRALGRGNPRQPPAPPHKEPTLVLRAPQPCISERNAVGEFCCPTIPSTKRVNQTLVNSDVRSTFALHQEQFFFQSGVKETIR